MMCIKPQVVLLLAVLALAKASITASPAKIIQGPSSKSTVIGPDGSFISSFTPGGQIIAEDTSGFAAYTIPVVKTPSVIATYSPPLIAKASYYTPSLAAYPHGYPHGYSHGHGIPIAYSNGIVEENALDTVIAGPSGTITTSKRVTNPAFARHYTFPGIYSGYY